MNRSFLPIICLVLGTIAGWFSATNPAEETSKTEPTRLSPRQERDRSRTKSLAIPPDIAARLAPIHAARSPEERLRAIIHLARTIPVSELHRWYDAKWLKFQDGGDLNVFYEITRNRWLTEDPTGIMERALAKDWSNFGELANRWARTDPDTALAYFQSIKNPADRKRFEQSMVAALAATRPDEVLRMIDGFIDPNQGDYHWIGALKALADHHPGLLESADLPHNLRDTARTMLVRSRLERDFNGEFNRLIASPDGHADFLKAINDHDIATKFSKELLAQIHRFPADWFNVLASQSHFLTRDNAEAWLELDLQALGMTETNSNNFRNTAWQLLAQTNPSKVLESLTDLESPTDRNIDSYLTIALRTLNRKSPEEAAQWLAHYESRTDNESLKQQLQQAMASDAQARQKPTAESLLQNFQQSTTERSSLFSLQNEYQNAPPDVQKEFTNSILAMEPESLSQIGYSNESYHFNRFPTALQANLINSMIEHPPAEATPEQQRNLITNASTLAIKWVIEDPGAASRWVAQLPVGEPRQWALRNVALNWMPYDPIRSEAWLKQLPASDQADVQEFLESTEKTR
jgi:hypothetical protein